MRTAPWRSSYGMADERGDCSKHATLPERKQREKKTPHICSSLLSHP